MNENYNKLTNGHLLEIDEAESLMLDICEQRLNEYQASFILGLYKLREIKLNELIGFKNALMKLCTPLNLQIETMDVCGTGGDNKNTFNISTLSSFVLAASNIPIAKHGNFASTSVSGSSDILKYFGYNFKTKEEELINDLEKHKLCFIHAPNFHPALKNLVPIRKNLKTSTLFNLMGPLVNPANPKFKYVGVFNKKVSRLYNYFLQTSEINYSLVHSLDGYDEISLTSDLLIITNETEAIISTDELIFPKIEPNEIIAGDTIESASKIFLNVLENKATAAQKNVVIINSAMAMQCFTKKGLDECAAICTETIESKKAYNLFNQLINN